MVRRIAEGEWAELRDIRLRLLADVPWRATALAVERTYDEAFWRARARVAASSEHRVAFIAGEWIGIVEAVVHRARDTAEIEGFWVAAESRRCGVGTALLDAAAVWSAEGGLAQLESWVREENAPAIAAHARAGFAVTGDVIRWPERSDWQIRMVRNLR